MSTAREEILRAVRQATRDVPGDERPTASPAPPRPAPPGPERAERFAARVADYRATVTPVRGDGVAEAIGARLAAHAARRVVVPPGLPEAWVAAVPVPRVDEPPLSHEALAAADGVLTGCRLAVAETGTIVLDGEAGQGRRALTLLPDLHLCVVLAGQVHDDVEDALAALASRPGRPMTWISGPSATSDIELQRVEGVHGPRRLEVLLVLDDPPPAA